jgi:ketosteroid isomerase-like protein
MIPKKHAPDLIRGGYRFSVKIMPKTNNDREASVQDFPGMLARFAKAVEANDGATFAALFAEDGAYVDGFYGEFKGRAAIIKMLQHFHDTATNYRWDFFAPMSDGKAGYARYRFSYASTFPGAEGKTVMFEGISYFTFRNGLIERYEEVLDRGVAFAQLDFAGERIKKILLKEIARQNGTEAAREHMKRFG